MRGLARLLKWLAIALAGLALVLITPVIYVETLCQGDAAPAPAPPQAPGTRPEIRTLLTYPEWHIVHAYDDYAEVTRTGDPHDFAYTRAVLGYWDALCTLTTEAASLGEIDAETRQLVHVIGVSFTFEMMMKAAYEETLGRLATWIRGPTRAPLDALAAEQAAAYAAFLQQVPWYRYDFRADARALRAQATAIFRDRERALALGLEHGARARYAALIAQAVAATGHDELTLHMVVSDLAAATLAQADGVRIIAESPAGTRIETPRYRALTRLLAEWADRGAQFVEIAGNDEIMFTALSEAPHHAGALASLPRQGYGDSRHLFLVPVAELAETLRGLPDRGLSLEHIHDY